MVNSAAMKIGVQHTPSKFLTPNTIILGLKISTYEFWRDINIQSIATCKGKMGGSWKRLRELSEPCRSDLGEGEREPHTAAPF